MADLPCKWCGARPVVSRRSRLCEACSQKMKVKRHRMESAWAEAEGSADSDTTGPGANPDPAQRDIGPGYLPDQEAST